MHAANEFIWLHADEVSGFPIVGIHASPHRTMISDTPIEKRTLASHLLICLALSLLEFAAATLIKGP